MDYKKTLEYLTKLDEHKTMNLSLEKVQAILSHLPFQLNSITFIQVAGTNGKGSTAHFLASVLQASGRKVGLFTSPHLHDVRERIKVDNRVIPETDFAACIGAVKELSQQLLQKEVITDMPSYFEYIFLACLYHFSREHVAAAVLEVGLGGRLDATSTITPTLSIITGISHDHTAILGRHIKDIAAEKAGIIKKGVPVVCGCNVHSVSHAVIRKKARELDAPFYPVIDSQNRLTIEDLANCYHCRYIINKDNFEFDVYMNGRHQPRNAAAVIKAVQILNEMGFTISPESVREGIKNTHVPARIELIEKHTNNPNPINIPVILDSSHNVESIKMLCDFLAQKKKDRLTLIFGVLEDKNYRQMTRLLLPFVENVIISEPLSRRALSAEKLAHLFVQKGLKNVQVQQDLKKALDIALKWQREILVTGSFYLVGEMRYIIMHGG
jgi:folylpolyglutamate synthase/dihydrofolate synthase